MSMADRDGFIWYDGKLVPWREATTHVLTHSLHYGMGVFEGVRAYNTANQGTAIFRLQDHTDRLYRSAHIFRMKIPYEKEHLNEVQRQVVRDNKLASAYLRPLVFYGSEGMGLRADGLKAEDAVKLFQIVREMQRVLGTEDVACVIDAKHLCVNSRGIRDVDSSTVTAEYGGRFRQEESLRREFLDYINLDTEF